MPVNEGLGRRSELPFEEGCPESSDLGVVLNLITWIVTVGSEYLRQELIFGIRGNQVIAKDSRTESRGIRGRLRIRGGEGKVGGGEGGDQMAGGG